MKILKNYILKEHLKPFLLGLAVFIFILFMGNMGDVIRMAFGQKTELLSVVKIVFNIIIYAASFSIPMATLLAVLLAMGRFNSDNEITAVRACGINPVWLMSPVILTAVLISLASVHLNSSIVPRTSSQTERLLADLASKDPSMFLRERTLIEDFENYVIYIQRKKDDNLYGVQITQLREKGFPVNITAREGTIAKSRDPGRILLKLTDGTMDETEFQEPYRYSRSRFREYHITLPLPEQGGASSRVRPKDMTIPQLREKSAELASMNMNVSPLITEINRKLAQSFAPLAFALIAIPLSLKFKRGGKSTGFGLCLIMVIIYYVLFTLSETLGEKGITTEKIVWAPNIILGFSGILLSLRLK